MERVGAWLDSGRVDGAIDGLVAIGCTIDVVDMPLESVAMTPRGRCFKNSTRAGSKQSPHPPTLSCTAGNISSEETRRQ